MVYKIIKISMLRVALWHLFIFWLTGNVGGIVLPLLVCGMFAGQCSRQGLNFTWPTMVVLNSNKIKLLFIEILSILTIFLQSILLTNQSSNPYLYKSISHLYLEKLFIFLCILLRNF